MPSTTQLCIYAYGWQMNEQGNVEKITVIYFG